MIKKNAVGVIVYIISSLIVCIYLKTENDNLRKNLQEISDTNVDRIVDLIACRETSSNLREELTICQGLVTLKEAAEDSK
jgi:hypothetical protein